jgi:hypothetical protein
MTPARITPARVFLYPRLAARGERVARDARVVCALRVARVLRDVRVRVIRFASLGFPPHPNKTQKRIQLNQSLIN